MDHHHIAYCLLVYCNILPYCNIRLDFVKNLFMETSCTQLHMFYVANKSRELETSTYYNLYAFVCHFIFQSAKTTQYLVAIYCNILQYIAIRNISIFSIGHIVLYCSSKYCNIAIFQYIVSPLTYIHYICICDQICKKGSYTCTHASNFSTSKICN